MDLVDDGVTGFLVPPGDADAFANAVARLAADPVLRAAFGAAGRRKVLGRTWTALTDELIGHYAPSCPPPTRLAEFGWMATRGTAWLLRRSRDLVPALATLAIREWLSAYHEIEERELVPVGKNPSA